MQSLQLTSTSHICTLQRHKLNPSSHMITCKDSVEFLLLMTNFDGVSSGAEQLCYVQQGHI